MRHLTTAVFLLAALAAHAGAEGPPRTVTTNGEAVVRVVPDEATLTLGVETRDRNLATARDRAGGVVTAFLGAARELGITAQDTTTVGAHMRPDYETDRETGERRLLGYVVTRDIVVRLSNLEALGPLIEAATSAGVNRVQPARLTSSRRAELEREALADAVRDARRRAEAAAAALDARVGKVRSIDAAPVRVQPIVRRAEMLAADSAGGDWQPGEMEIPADVTVAFDLDP